MINWFRKTFLDSNDKYIRTLMPFVDSVNALEEECDALSRAQRALYTEELKKEVQNGASMDDIMPRAFALTRATAKSEIGQRHYDVQIMGGYVLCKGQIAEMGTGEGKTLTATLAAVTRAIMGDSVHIVTVNDYLARRDASGMGAIYHALGLSVSVIQQGNAFAYAPSKQDDEVIMGIEVDRDVLKLSSVSEGYKADIVYGTNTTFGFDYLRDNMAYDAAQKKQRKLAYAVIDEIDSILIDEARTPLIISSSGEDPEEAYYTYAKLVATLKPGTHYDVNEKHRHVGLTDAGIENVEHGLGIRQLYNPEHLAEVNHVEKALKAKALFTKDKDYIVQDGTVKIVDEFTGRILEGRRYSEGLHQAIEAKENVEIQRESKTVASITIQNYFRQYETLAGMTGTALTEAEEFSKIYKLETVSVPPNKPSRRVDMPDTIYATRKGKLNAVVERIRRAYDSGQPVLVGTVSIEHNEELSMLLSHAGIPHTVLNAKQHEQEGMIIAQAGAPKSVTIATNMAGRGVDIVLGGNPATPENRTLVLNAGGLLVIGTERHESRRIDNQLRGRSGRQGDPGETVFFVSLEDDLMRIFGSERIKTMMTRLGVPENEAIENSMITNAIAGAQKKVEGFHFDNRKHVLEYDNVLNKQREIIYKKRDSALFAKRIDDTNTLSETGKEIWEIIDDYLRAARDRLTAEPSETEQIIHELSVINDVPEDMQHAIRALTNESTEEEIASLIEHVREKWMREYMEAQATAENLIPEYGYIALERMLWLNAIDQLWVEHMQAMDQLRSGINLRHYAQKEPLVEYQHESYRLFNALLDEIRERIAQFALKLSVAKTPNMSSVFSGPVTMNNPAEAEEFKKQPAPQTVEKPDDTSVGNRSERRKAKKRKM